MAEASPGANIGRNIRAVRERKLFSRTDLAERSGLSVAGIDQLERGLSARPRRRTIEKIAEALDVDVDTLMEEAAYPLAEAPPSAQLTLNGLLGEERGRPTDSEISALGRWLSYLERRLNERSLTRDEIVHELDAASAAGIRRFPAEYPDELYHKFMRLVRRALEEGKSFDALQTAVAGFEADMDRMEERHAQTKDRHK